MTKLDKIYKVFMTVMIIATISILLATGVLALTKSMSLQSKIDMIPNAKIEMYIHEIANQYTSEDLVFRNFENGNNKVYVNNNFSSLSANKISLNDVFSSKFGSTFFITIKNYDKENGLKIKITSDATLLLDNLTAGVPAEVIPSLSGVKLCVDENNAPSETFEVITQPIVSQNTFLYFEMTPCEVNEINVVTGNSSISINKIFGNEIFSAEVFADNGYLLPSEIMVEGVSDYEWTLSKDRKSALITIDPSNITDYSNLQISFVPTLINSTISFMTSSDNFDSNLTLYSNKQYRATGYILDFEKDFQFELSFKVPKSGVRHLIVGNYPATNVFNLEVNSSSQTGNFIRIYMQAGGTLLDTFTSTAITIGEEVFLQFFWMASNDTYTLTAKGNQTNIYATGTHSMSGVCQNGLNIGASDHRANSGFNDIYTSALIFKYSKNINYGSQIGTLPNVLERAGYDFSGWFTAPYGGVEISGNIIFNNTNDVVYYAQWMPKCYVVNYKQGSSDNFNFTDIGSYNADNKVETGYIIDWDSDFTLEIVFNASTSGCRYLIAGAYVGGSVKNELNIEVNTSNQIRVYMNGGGTDAKSTNTITFNENIKITYQWLADENSWSLTAVGTATNISMSGTYNMSGVSFNGLNIGYDHRAGTTTFTTLKASSLVITKSKTVTMGERYGTLEFWTRNGKVFNGYYTATSGGYLISDASIVQTPSDHILYAQWI